MKFVGAGLLTLLSETAENGYGRGEMVHILLKDDKQMHKQVSVISAMIIRDKKVLHTLLIKHGGLYTMIELILTKDEQLTNEAATGLTGKYIQQFFFLYLFQSALNPFYSLNNWFVCLFVFRSIGTYIGNCTAKIRYESNIKA